MDGWSFSSFGSVFQWIEFQIPILKMQVRFLPGLPQSRQARQNFSVIGKVFSGLSLCGPEAIASLLQEVTKTDFFSRLHSRSVLRAPIP
jgi:hypothetical protein